MRSSRDACSSRPRTVQELARNVDFAADHQCSVTRSRSRRAGAANAIRGFERAEGALRRVQFDEKARHVVLELIQLLQAAQLGRLSAWASS